MMQNDMMTMAQTRLGKLYSSFSQAIPKTEKWLCGELSTTQGGRWTMGMVCALSSLCGGVAQKGLGFRNRLGGEIIRCKTRRRPQRSHACCMYFPAF